MPGTVTRAQLSEAVYQEVGLSRNESAELVENVLDEIVESLVRGDTVKISSFGSFQVPWTLGSSVGAAVTSSSARAVPTPRESAASAVKHASPCRAPIRVIVESPPPCHGACASRRACQSGRAENH